MTQSIITSTANPIIKRIRALGVKKYRDEDGLFIVEGLRHVGDALANGWEVNTLVFSNKARPQAQEIIGKYKVKALEVTDDILANITQRDNAQPLLGVFKQRMQNIDSVKDGLWLGLEEIRDPGNLGTIIRTADAVAVKGIILIGNCCDPWSPEVIRATMGSFARIPLVRVTQAEFIKWRKSYKGQVIGTHLHQKSVDYRKTNTKLPLLLLMGSESTGLSPDIAAVCDTLVKIPMTGGTESLNLAVSTGIMLYEICRERT